MGDWSPLLHGHRPWHIDGATDMGARACGGGKSLTVKKPELLFLVTVSPQASGLGHQSIGCKVHKVLA